MSENKITNLEELIVSVSKETELPQNQTAKTLMTAKNLIIESIKKGNDFKVTGLVSFKHVLLKGRDYKLGGKEGHTEDHEIVRAKASSALYK